MDEPPSDGKINAIDVFILSTDETVALQLTELLGQKDYRVTVFSDASGLLETLRSGKPNLLICDSRTDDSDGFGFCRQIKADNDLWIIPVLILTAASTIEDLLLVLDSNADNFIAHPFDLPYHLLLIEGMLSTPVERQTPDQIKTQFKISHDDRTYVVAANRRKLLEYLLSAFEIAVNKSSELSHMTSDLQEFSVSLKDLEKRVTEHIHIIETMNGTLEQKEQNILVLSRKADEQALALAQKTAEIQKLLKEHDADTTRIASQEENLQAMVRKQEELKTTHRSGIEELTSRISSFETASAALKTRLDTLQGALDNEKTRSASLEKTLRALTLEHEQQKSAFAAEKNRAIASEQEISAVMQAKIQSEQDLTQMITELRETAKHQAAELTRLKGEIETESSNRLLAEKQSADLQQKFENSVSALQAEKKKTEEKLDAVSAQLTEAQAAIVSGEQKRRSLVDNLEAVISQKEKSGDRLQDVEKELAEAQAALASGEQKRRSLSETLEKALTEKENSEQKLKTWSHALDKAQSDIESVITGRNALEDNLKRITRERDAALAKLQRDEAETRKDLDSLKVSLEQRERELSAVTAIRSTLEKELESVKNKNKALEKDIDLAAQYRVQSGQQSRTLADELEQVKAALETERRLRRIAEEKIKSATQQHEDIEQHLRSANEDIERTEKDRDATLRHYKEKLDYAGTQIRSLESRIRVLSQEKLHAEQNLQELKTGRNPAKSATEEEQSSPKDKEGQDGAGDEQRNEHPSLSQPEATGSPADNVQLIIADEPNLPVPVEPVSLSLMAQTNPVRDQSPVASKDVPAGGLSGAVPRVFTGGIHGVSDLSGADTLVVKNLPETKNGESEQVPSEGNDRSEENIPGENLPETEPGAGEVADPEAKETSTQTEPDTEDEPEDSQKEDEYDEQSAEIPEEYDEPFPRGGFSFNRNDWINLLKWAHHSGVVSQEQRLKIVKIGRIAKNDRNLTGKQQDQVREIIAMVYALGYRPG